MNTRNLHPRFGFCRDSGGSLILASRHPTWSLTWSWLILWGPPRPGRFFFCWRTYRYVRGLYGVICLGRLRFERQPTMRA